MAKNLHGLDRKMRRNGRSDLEDGDCWERLIRRVGIALGFLTILFPFLIYRRTSLRPTNRVAGSPPKSMTWPGMLLASFGYLALGIAGWHPLPVRLARWWQRFCTAAGALLYFPGIGLYWWGLKTLGDFFRPSSSRRADLYTDHQLVVNGPYAILRHPMYLGVLMAAAGALLIYRTWTTVIYALSSWVVLARVHHEEAALEVMFGDEWVAYKAEIPAWFPAWFFPNKGRRTSHLM